MAANHPSKGRPRRPEGIKRLKLRQSTYNLWNERKAALGVHGITNSEFAEILLHQNVSVRTPRLSEKQQSLLHQIKVRLLKTLHGRTLEFLLVLFCNSYNEQRFFPVVIQVIATVSVREIFTMPLFRPLKEEGSYLCSQPQWEALMPWENYQFHHSKLLVLLTTHLQASKSLKL